MRYFTAAFALPVFGALSFFGAMPAHAQDKPFEGAKITAITGADLNLQFGDGQAGLLYGGQLGYDWQHGRTVFGIEGEVAGATTGQCSKNVVAPVRYCKEAGRDLYVGGRLGQMIGASTLIYVKAGYTNYRESVDYGDASNSYRGSAVVEGVRGGIGIEQAIGNTLLIKTEYRYSNYDGAYSRHQAVAGIGIRF